MDHEVQGVAGSRVTERLVSPALGFYSNSNESSWRVLSRVT